MRIIAGWMILSKHYLVSSSIVEHVNNCSILEKATNPKNRYEDWEFIMAFCDKVNASPEGWGTIIIW